MNKLSLEYWRFQKILCLLDRCNKGTLEAIKEYINKTLEEEK